MISTGQTTLRAACSTSVVSKLASANTRGRMNQLFALSVWVHPVTQDSNPTPSFVERMMNGTGESFAAVHRDGDFFFKLIAKYQLQAL
jgi:hypothetical protein